MDLERAEYTEWRCMFVDPGFKYKHKAEMAVPKPGQSKGMEASQNTSALWPPQSDGTPASGGLTERRINHL